jgi:hypothetical protein
VNQIELEDLYAIIKYEVLELDINIGQYAQKNELKEHVSDHVVK